MACKPSNVLAWVRMSHPRKVLFRFYTYGVIYLTLLFAPICIKRAGFTSHSMSFVRVYRNVSKTHPTLSHQDTYAQWPPSMQAQQV